MDLQGTWSFTSWWSSTVAFCQPGILGLDWWIWIHPLVVSFHTIFPWYNYNQLQIIPWIPQHFGNSDCSILETCCESSTRRSILGFEYIFLYLMILERNLRPEKDCIPEMEVTIINIGSPKSRLVTGEKISQREDFTHQVVWEAGEKVPFWCHTSDSA